MKTVSIFAASLLLLSVLAALAACSGGNSGGDSEIPGWDDPFGKGAPATDSFPVSGAAAAPPAASPAVSPEAREAVVSPAAPCAGESGGVVSLVYGDFEGGASGPDRVARFSVRLGSCPSSDVVVPLFSSDPLQGVPVPSALTFTPGGLVRHPGGRRCRQGPGPRRLRRDLPPLGGAGAERGLRL